MKTNQFLRLATVLLVIGTATACKEDFLDQKPNNSITDENFYQTEIDAVRATNSVYSPAQGLYNGAAWQILDAPPDRSL